VFRHRILGKLFLSITPGANIVTTKGVVKCPWHPLSCYCPARRQPRIQAGSLHYVSCRRWY